VSATAERMIELAIAMAQDLREYADAASEAGASIEATEHLLEEFDRVMMQLDQEAHEESYNKDLPEWVQRLGVKP
jgi:hypothetical protein